MIVIDLKDEISIMNPTFIGLGNFDGLHLGHRKLLSTLVEMGKKFSCETSVLLFNNHTKTLTSGKKPPSVLIMDEKIKFLEEAGIDFAYRIDFDEKLRNMSKSEFIDFLTDKLKIKGIVVGSDYKFGINRSGNCDFIKSYSLKKNYKAFFVDELKYDGKTVSTTEIRNLISNGNIEKANSLLGYDYFISGKVVHGKGLGKSLGFATANIFPTDDKIVPGDGVYATVAEFNGKRYKAATSVGRNPTFENDGFKIESHILDFNSDLYGEEIKIIFIKKIRDIYKFDSLSKLKEFVLKDIEFIKKYDLH